MNAQVTQFLNRRRVHVADAARRPAADTSSHH